MQLKLSQNWAASKAQDKEESWTMQSIGCSKCLYFLMSSAKVFEPLSLKKVTARLLNVFKN